MDAEWHTPFPYEYVRLAHAQGLKSTVLDHYLEYHTWHPYRQSELAFSDASLDFCYTPECCL